jgi:hypothetical protein
LQRDYAERRAAPLTLEHHPGKLGLSATSASDHIVLC